MSPTVDDTMVAIRNIYNTALKSTPWAAIFGRDMLFDIPYMADWNKIGHRRQEQVESTNTRENKRRIPYAYDYAGGHRILICKDGILRKTKTKY